jgi:hypothetical protein
MANARDAPNPPNTSMGSGNTIELRAAPGTPLGDPRSHPGTRTAGEGLITAGRGQAPNAQTFAGRALR